MFSMVTLGKGTGKSSDLHPYFKSIFRTLTFSLHSEYKRYSSPRVLINVWFWLSSLTWLPSFL